LSLPGDQNQLIEAVAQANRRTVVVLNTGGAVLMPWLNRVSGVLETWYPGQQFGPAIACRSPPRPPRTRDRHRPASPTTIRESMASRATTRDSMWATAGMTPPD